MALGDFEGGDLFAHDRGLVRVGGTHRGVEDTFRGHQATRCLVPDGINSIMAYIKEGLKNEIKTSKAAQVTRRRNRVNRNLQH